ncbi:hypothetical protein [Stenotrophomonas maltophilia]|uniref:hypothetical protein n=1 Tax=Stenotrophomonas maltophilia TaxID=40324 RepID=UPI0015E05E23|nr:hypothetical protein [Stenotrophomonas maltophilia]MBA0284431.1 hypothetical protein [Stenotrophomonas maltophilia]MBA0323698.1 hypothetical protein [Stenotrophomonas maltophilia]
MKQTQPSINLAPGSAPIPDSAIEAFRAAYANHGAQNGYADAIRAGLAAAAPLITQDAMLSLEQDAHNYLVRQLDVALNGETNAARAPALPDLLSQCQAEARRRSGPVLTTLPISAQHHLRQVFKDLADGARSLSDSAVREVVLLGTTEARL